MKLYTGNDLNCVELIERDSEHVSHGLLSIFDPIAPAVAVAFDWLAAGDNAGYREILNPRAALSRKRFEASMRFYKAGAVFLAGIAGHQNHFRMIASLESARGLLHDVERFRLADRARLFADSERAAWRAVSFAPSTAFRSRTKGARDAGPRAPRGRYFTFGGALPLQNPPLVKVSGGPYECGRQHGRACGDLIRRYPSVLLEVISLEGRWRALDRASALGKPEDLLSRAMTFLPAMEAFAPHLVEEIRGIADGAKVSFAEALLVNVRAEVMGATASEALCTSFAVGREVTAGGTVLSGQNLDQHPANRDLMIILHVEPDRGPAILMCTFAGLVGYPGINSECLSLFQNALSTKYWRRDGMPHYFLKRVLLEQQCASDCVAVAREVRVCSSTNYVITDRSGTLCNLELAPNRCALLTGNRGIVVHANHFCSPVLAPEEALLQNIPDSALRHIRMEVLLSEHHGRIKLDNLKSALADHQGWPTSICRHESNVKTIASLIAEPDQGRLHVAAGNACETEYIAYSL